MTEDEMARQATLLMLRGIGTASAVFAAVFFIVSLASRRLPADITVRQDSLRAARSWGLVAGGLLVPVIVIAVISLLRSHTLDNHIVAAFTFIFTIVGLGAVGTVLLHLVRAVLSRR